MEKSVRVSPQLQYALVAFIGVALGLLAMFTMRHRNTLDVVDRLDRRAEQLAVSIQQSIDAKLQVLQAFQAFYAVDGVVNADEFKKFAVVTLIYNRDIQALQWIPYVPQAEVETFLAAGTLIYGEDFVIKERNADGAFVDVPTRDYYFPILYTEPYEGNEHAIGLDAAFEPVRRSVIEHAWRTGNVSVSDPIRLVQETGNQMGVLIYQPMYDTPLPPETEAARLENILGLVPVVLRAGDFMSNSLRDYDTLGFDIQLYDRLQPETILYHKADSAGAGDAFAVVKTIRLANRQWDLMFKVSSAYIETEIRFNGIASFGLVLLLFAVLLLYLWQRNRADAALRDYAVTLEEANRELDAYNHTIAHDLKSPLAVINGYAHLLADEELSAAGHKMVETVPRVVHSMVEMIDGMLQLTKLRHGDVEMSVVDMNLALKKALERFGSERKHITVASELPPALAQESWMVEVFANLINNAIKYARPDEEPIIHIRSLPADKFIRYEVIDNGIGIQPKDQKHIFDMFTRVYGEDGIAQGYKGLGIGLSIVQRIIRRSGGDVGVDSVFGEGCTFWFTLRHPDA